jgi:formate dehydrogenase subunit gamma
MTTLTESMVLRKGIGKSIFRFDVQQIIQHGGLALSFIVLVITGVPLKYSNLGISQWWAAVWGGADNLRTGHHVAAYMIVAVSLYHLVYIFISVVIQKKSFPINMVPGPKDAVKAIQEIAYFFGVRKERPEFGRFNWREKFDYWAIFWGMPVMVISGFILMFPVQTTNVLPGWVVPTALIAHSDEAMLALTWIFLVHIFFNHFAPGVTVKNTTMFSGKVPRERYIHDHPLEYEHLVEIDKGAAKSPPPAAPESSGGQ